MYWLRVSKGQFGGLIWEVVYLPTGWNQDVPKGTLMSLPIERPNNFTHATLDYLTDEVNGYIEKAFLADLSDADYSFEAMRKAQAVVRKTIEKFCL